MVINKNAMSKTNAFIIILIVLFTNSAYARVFRTIQDGNFDNPSIWDKEEVPLFDSDTIHIFHHVVYSRDSQMMGIKHCKKRPLIIVERTAKFCLMRPYNLYSLIIYSYGKMITDSLEYRGVDHYILNDTVLEHGRVMMTIHGAVYPGKIVAAQRGVMQVIKGKFDCNTLINEDTEMYSANCPKGMFFIQDSIGIDTTIKYWLYSNIPMNFVFSFPDTTIIKATGDSISYKARIDPLKLKVKMNDLYDRGYQFEKEYKFSNYTSNVYSSNSSKAPLVDILMMPSMINIRGETGKEYVATIYDLTMKKVYEERFYSETSIDNFHLNVPAGHYIILLSDRNGKVIKSEKVRL